VLRNYASGNGIANQLVSAGSINFGIGAVGTASDNVIEQNVVMGNSNGIFVSTDTRRNVISQNIATGNPPLQLSQSFTTSNCANLPCSGGDIRNHAPDGSNTIADNHCITFVTRTSFSNSPCRIFLPASEPHPLATGVLFDSSRVAAGGSFTATFSGSNLSNETYFDLRVRAPGASIDDIILNWQRGASARHSLPPGTAVGDWKVTGVRAHQDINEHTGPVATVEAIVSVFVSPFAF
jgi:parallel beta-helix repeat protein